MQTTMKTEEREHGVRALIKQQVDSFDTIRGTILKVNQQMLPGLDWIEVKIASVTTREESNYYWHYEYRLTLVSSFIRGRSLLQLAKLRVESGGNYTHGQTRVIESSMSSNFDEILAKWDALLNREAERNKPNGVSYVQHITFHADPVLGGEAK